MIVTMELADGTTWTDGFGAAIDLAPLNPDQVPTSPSACHRILLDLMDSSGDVENFQGVTDLALAAGTVSGTYVFTVTDGNGEHAFTLHGKSRLGIKRRDLASGMFGWYRPFPKVEDITSLSTS